MKLILQNGFLFLLLCSFTTSGFAADWSIVPRFSISELYSDNILVSSSNEQDDFVTRTTPGISVHGNGARLGLNVDYNLENLTYVNLDSRNAINHQLQSNFELEALRHRLFLRGNASVFQALVSGNRAITQGNIRQTNNRDDVITFGFVPELRHRFGNFANMRISSRFSETIRDQDRSGSGEGFNVRVNVDSGRRFTRFNWGVNYSRRENNNANNSSGSTRQNINFNANVPLNRKIKVKGRVGLADNDFAARSGQNDNGLTWSVGGTYTPSPRTSLSANFGEESFGSSKSFSLTHRHRRISITANYNERLRTSQEVLEEQQIIRTEDAFGNPVFNTNEISNLILPIDTLTLVDEVFVDRTFRSTIGYFRKRDNFNVSVFHSDQEGQETTGTDQSTGFTASWSRTNSTRLSSGLSFTFRSGGGNRFGRNESTSQQFRQSAIRGSDQLFPTQNQNGDSDTYFITPNLSYLIGPHVSASLSYTYSKSKSEIVSNNYVENSISLALNFAL